MTPFCVCGHHSANHFAHTGHCYDGACGCSYFLLLDGECETEACAGGLMPDLYCGFYSGKKWTL